MSGCAFTIRETPYAVLLPDEIDVHFTTGLDSRAALQR
jgi:hypothetical protein